MITSTQNSRIVNARKLTQRKYREQQNRFLVEGLQLLSLAVQNPSLKPQELFYCESLFTGETAPRLLTKLQQAGAEAIAVSENVLAALSDRDTPQGLVATFTLSGLELTPNELLKECSKLTSAPRPPTPDPQLILIVDKLQDPGNLGTLIRTADAVGVMAVVLLEPCVDPFDPKTVRGTMGSLFTIPFARLRDSADFLPKLAQAGYRLVGADGRRGKPPWQSEVLVGAVALVLGNEARGLSPELHAHLNDYVALPLRGQAESLNVSVAGGTLMYEWLRVNLIKN